MKYKVGILLALLGIAVSGVRGAINPNIISIDLDIGAVIVPNTSDTPDDPAEADPGGFVCLGGQKAITFTSSAEQSTAKVRLSWDTGQIQVEEAAGIAVTPTGSYGDGNAYKDYDANKTVTLYVKGIAVSEDSMDEAITLEALHNTTINDTVTFTVVDVETLTGTEVLHSVNTTNDTTQADDYNPVWICQTSNNAATLKLELSWLPTNCPPTKFRWEALLTNGAVANEWGGPATFENNPTNITWTPGSPTNREFHIRAWFDCDENGVYTNTEPHRIIDVTVVDFVELMLTNSACSNSVTDATRLDEPASINNTLYLCEGTNGTAEMDIQGWWLPENVNSNWFRWEFRLTNGVDDVDEWDIEEGTFATNAVSVTWTASGDTNREFLVRGWYDCDRDGEYDPDEPHRMLYVSVLKIEFVHADGDNEGEPMDYLPIFDPSSGAGAGIATYSFAPPDLTVTLSGALVPDLADSLSISWLGTNYTVVETGNDTLLFEDAEGIISVLLPEKPLADTNVLEYLPIEISMPASGIVGATYASVETSAESLIFANRRYAVELVISSLTDDSEDSMQLTIYDALRVECQMAETEAASCFFASEGSNATVLLVRSPMLTPEVDVLYAAVSTSSDLANTVFRLEESGPLTGVFRNFDVETAPSSLPDLPVPDYASWRIRIQGTYDPAIFADQEVRTDSDIYPDITFSPAASILSDQKFVLMPTSAMPDEFPDGYEVLQIDPDAVDWSDPETLEVAFVGDLAGGAAWPVAKAIYKRIKAQTPGSVLQSLEILGLDWAAGVKPDSNIRKPLYDMGYSMKRNYSVTKSQALEEYIPGGQILYLMCHGATEDWSPYSEFLGLGLLNKESIVKSEIQALNLNYRLVIMDACCSAQTVYGSRPQAQNNDTLSANAQQFTASFGPKAAYLGWSWKEHPGLAQKIMSELVGHLERGLLQSKGRTVQEALDKIRAEYSDTPWVKELKLHGAGDNVVDPPFKPPESGESGEG